MAPKAISSCLNLAVMKQSKIQCGFRFDCSGRAKSGCSVNKIQGAVFRKNIFDLLIVDWVLLHIKGSPPPLAGQTFDQSLIEITVTLARPVNNEMSNPTLIN